MAAQSTTVPMKRPKKRVLLMLHKDVIVPMHKAALIEGIPFSYWVEMAILERLLRGAATKAKTPRKRKA